MTDKEKILSFLKALRESDFYIPYIYTCGGCYQLYKVLKTIFPTAQPYLGVYCAHVITEIDGVFYDISGELKISDEEFLPLTDEEEQECKTWSFAANNDLYLGECPVCGQPITIDRKKLIK